MSALALEPFALQFLENERLALDYLNRSAPHWHFELDLTGGELVFREPGTGRVLFSSEIKLIGTYAEATRQFRFGWSDPAIPEDWKCVTGLGALRVTARGAGLSVFDEDAPLSLASLAQPQLWALQCAGFLKAEFVFEARKDGMTRFLSVASFPDWVRGERSPELVQQVVKEGIQRLPLQHRAAIEAYLGRPQRAGATNLADETFYWQVGEAQLRVSFSHRGQLLSADLELPQPIVLVPPTATSAAPAAPEPPSQLGRVVRLLDKWKRR